MNYIAGPLIGAIIGYITNYIAIKMLFRPLEPKYLFGKQLPFTPGIIPRRKNQLADALGKAVFDKFFNWDDLEIVFLSDEFVNQVVEQVDLSIKDDLTVGQLQENFTEDVISQINMSMSTMICREIVDSGLIRKVTMDSGAWLNQADGKPTGNKLLVSMVTAYAGPIAEQLENYISENGPALVCEVMQEKCVALKDEKIYDRLGSFVTEAQLKDSLKNIYMHFMRKNVRPIVESIDIVTQITEKMNQMTAGEVESLVLDIVSKELRMIVWFGAMLGAVIGIVNIFI